MQLHLAGNGTLTEALVRTFADRRQRGRPLLLAQRCRKRHLVIIPRGFQRDLLSRWWYKRVPCPHGASIEPQLAGNSAIRETLLRYVMHRRNPALSARLACQRWVSGSFG